MREDLAFLKEALQIYRGKTAEAAEPTS